MLFGKGSVLRLRVPREKVLFGIKQSNSHGFQGLFLYVMINLCMGASDFKTPDPATSWR